MKKSEIIKDLYFNKEYTQKEISKQLDITKQYISKVLTQDKRYKQEKEKRMKSNRMKHIERTKKYIKTARKKASNNYDIIKVQHYQASCELSIRKPVNNRAFRNWNPSIYKFHNKTKEYRAKEEMLDKLSYAVPKRIKWY